MNNYNEYLEFAIRCFKYLNCKINTVNIACGIQILSSLESNDFGRTNTFNISLYLYLIIIVYKSEVLIKNAIIEVITHELSHMDQIVDRDIYEASVQYQEEIERQNHYNTYKYLIKNENIIKKELYSEFKAPCKEKLKNVIKNGIPMYRKINIEKLYTNILDQYIGYQNCNINEYTDIILEFDIANLNYNLIVYQLKNNNVYSDETIFLNKVILKLLHLYINIEVYEICFGNNKILKLLIKQDQCALIKDDEIMIQKETVLKMIKVV